VKPRLLPEVRFLPSEAGLSVRGPGHEAALHAPGLYPWFERVCPFLDGEHSVVDLVEKLSPMAAQRVLGLVEFLLREGFARDAQYDVPHTLSPATRSLHASVIEYLAREADSPERRFQSYRECAPVAVGSGRMLTATALALLATGVGHVRVHVVAEDGLSESTTDRDSLIECAKPLLHRDTAARLEFIEGEPRALPLDVGVLLYASDRPDQARAARLRNLAARMGVRHGEAIVSADEVVISQVSVPTGIVARATSPATGRPTSRYFGGPTAALAANQLCLSLLQHAAGLTALDGDHESGAVILDLRSTNFAAA
jgi:hypothetical protein